MEHNGQKDNSKKYLIIIIIILLLMNAFFIFHYVSTDRELTQTTEELTNVTSVRDELDKLLEESNEQLTLYKGKNAELDKLLESKNAEIQNKAKEIEDLIKKGKADARSLKKIREELDVLRYYVKKYKAQIDSLGKANQILVSKNKEISADLEKEKSRNENLTMNNIKLENKVNLGKKLAFTKLNITGINRRGSGRETETSRSKRIDLIKVEFTLDMNYLADLGTKDFYLRIISPEGSTLSSESTGGGSFRFQGEDALYTMKHSAEFDNTGQTIVFYYNKGSEWVSGDYKAELYADGFLIGSQNLRLR